MLRGQRRGKLTTLHLFLDTYSAKLVLSDIRLEAVEAVRDEIKRKGGEATATVCNVLNWEDQVAMFVRGVSSSLSSGRADSRCDSTDFSLPFPSSLETASRCQHLRSYRRRSRQRWYR